MPLYELYTSWQAQRAERAALLATLHPLHQKQGGVATARRRDAARHPAARTSRPAPAAAAKPVPAQPQQQLQARPVDLYCSRVKVRRVWAEAGAARGRARLRLV